MSDLPNDLLMSTLSQGDTTVDISDEILDTINFAPIVLDGVDEEFTDAVEIELTLTEGTSLRTETAGSTVLTGESLQGTAEDPASISLVTDGSNEAQLVAVNTSSIANTVITTAESVDGSSVAAAQVVISSETVESVSIKTASTEQKSQVRFDQSTDSLSGVRIEMEGAGGNLDIQSSSVDNLQVKAAGDQFSEITFGAEVEEVSNAQIEIGKSGGSLEMEGGTLASSTIAIASDRGAVNSVNITSDVESVTDTTLQLTKGASNIGIASATVKDVSVVANSKEPTSLVVNSADVKGFTLSVGKSEASLDLASESRIGGTTLASSTKGRFNAIIDAVTKNTAISNSKVGNIVAAFREKAINPSISNEGKGTVEANFESATKGAELESTRGAIEASFSGKVTDILVDASTSKGDVSLLFNSKVTDANLNFGRGSDEVIFGGSFGGSSSVDLGSDKNPDSVTISNPRKVNTPLAISSFGKQDTLVLGGQTFTYDQISEFTSTNSFPGIFGDNITVELI